MGSTVGRLGDVGSPLARRLQFNDTVSHYGTEVGWRIRAVFTWMRIVRAAKVQRARRRSGTWRANEQHRLHQIYESSQTTPITTQIRRPYTWHEQTEISSDTGATSGAAAVILKRRQAAACVHRDAPADKKQKVAVDDDESAQHTRERRVDSQSTNLLHECTPAIHRPHHVLEMAAANGRRLTPSV